MKARILVAALTAAGLMSGLPQASADVITPPSVVPPQPNPTTPLPAGYTVTYPVNVTIAGQATNFNATFNGQTGQWTTSNTNWVYQGPQAGNLNTAVFATTVSGTTYNVVVTDGTTQFVPGLGAPSTTSPPSVGVNLSNTPVTSSTLPGFTGATASGQVTGIGITTTTILPQTATVATVGSPAGVSVSLAGPAIATPTTATSGPGSASGSVAVNSNSATNQVSFGSYTVNIPTTPTPAGTTTVNGTITGTGGSLSSTGINIGNITGTATYNALTGVITANPVITNGFNVNQAGNVAIGCDTNTAATAGLVVCSGINRGGQALTIGSSGAPGPITINGQVTHNGPTTLNGTLAVSGATTTAGITNTGNIATTTLNVSGATTTNGITNTGNITTTGSINGATLGVTGNATVGGTLGVTGNTTIAGTLTTQSINTQGNQTISGTLGVTGNTTVGGTFGVTGATTLSGVTSIGGSGAGGNAIAVTNSGVALASGANASIVLNNSGAAIAGGATTLNLSTANGARFGGANGAPVVVSGVANGGNEFDAVNFGQFQDLRKRMAKGISTTSAMVNIPQVTEGKMFQIGVGVGGFDSETGVAVGGSARVGTAGIVKASVGTGTGNHSKTVWGIGGGWSW